MELIIFLIMLAIVISLYRDLKFVVYLFGILEIFFRIAHYIGDNLPLIRLNPVIDPYIPTSLFSVINKYTSGIINDIITWALVLGFIIFLYYLVKYFFNKK